MKRNPFYLMANLLIIVMLIFIQTSCFLFKNDAEPACRPCFATLPNGQTMEVETCSAEEEQTFMIEYRDFNPTCR